MNEYKMKVLLYNLQMPDAFVNTHQDHQILSDELSVWQLLPGLPPPCLLPCNVCPEEDSFCNHHYSDAFNKIYNVKPSTKHPSTLLIS